MNKFIQMPNNNSKLFNKNWKSALHGAKIKGLILCPTKG